MKRRHLLCVALLIGATTLLAGCTGRAAPDASTQPVDPRALVDSLPAATRAVDEVTWALAEGEPTTLDPAVLDSYIEPNLCDHLLQLQPDFGVEPGLALTADWVDDTTFVIELREGVSFWDETALTADDVVWSLQRNLDPAMTTYPSFVLVDSIEATGPLEVTVRFTAPDSTFRDALSGQGGAVLQKAWGEKAGTAVGTPEAGLMCTGPYEFVTWTPGAEIVTRANADYWGGAPLVNTMNYVFIPDSTTLTNALLQGEVDGVFNPAPSARGSLESSDAGRLIFGDSTSSYSFGPLNGESAAANVKIRQALSLAIDRQQYIDTVLGGTGFVQKTFLPPFGWNGLAAAEAYQRGYEALPDYAVDLDAARTLVAESGVDASVPLVLATAAGNTELRQTGAIIQSAAAKIGLTVEIDERQPADYASLFYDSASRDGVDLIATTGYLTSPGVLLYAQQFVLSPQLGGYYNLSGYDDSAVTADLAAARETLDPQASAQSYVSAQSVFAPDQLQVTLAGAYQRTFLREGLTGITTSIAVTSSPWALHLGGE